MSGPNQISNQPGSRVDSQHKRLHHIRSERPGTGHQLAERPAERDIAHSLPSSNKTWSSTSSSSLKSSRRPELASRGKKVVSRETRVNCGSQAVGAAAGASLAELR